MAIHVNNTRLSTGTQLRRWLIILSASALGLQGVGASMAQTTPVVNTRGPAVEEVTMSADAVIYQAVHSDERLLRDVARDIDRHPQEVLHFFDVQPGQSVLDLFSGGGYYTELLARVVGPSGHVIAHNNQAYLPFAKDDLAERDYAHRLSSVELLIAEADELTFEPAQFDRIFFILGFHDMFYAEDGWPAINRTRLVAQLFQSLKPGGNVAIVDHDAAEGSDISTAHTLHRLASAHVIELMTQAGFVLAGRSHVLENEQDPLTISVFDKSIKGKTSRYVLKFEKP